MLPKVTSSQSEIDTKFNTICNRIFGASQIYFTAAWIMLIRWQSALYFYLNLNFFCNYSSAKLKRNNSGLSEGVLHKF